MALPKGIRGSAVARIYRTCWSINRWISGSEKRSTLLAVDLCVREALDVMTVRCKHLPRASEPTERPSRRMLADAARRNLEIVSKYIDGASFAWSELKKIERCVDEAAMFAGIMEPWS